MICTVNAVSRFNSLDTLLQGKLHASGIILILTIPLPRWPSLSRPIRLSSFSGENDDLPKSRLGQLSKGGKEDLVLLTEVCAYRTYRVQVLPGSSFRPDVCGPLTLGAKQN